LLFLKGMVKRCFKRFWASCELTSMVLKHGEAGLLQVSRGNLPGPQVQCSHNIFSFTGSRESLVNPSRLFLLLADESVNG
jgi:hypothetical protein